MKIPLLLRTDEEWDGVEGAGVGVGALEPPVYCLLIMEEVLDFEGYSKNQSILMF